MKKLYNSIGVIVLIFTCCMICVSHIANKFFQEDIGKLIVSELRLDEQIVTLFDQVDGLVTPENEVAFLNLKEELINNEAVKQIVGSTTQEMMNDIVGDGGSNQDMKRVLKVMIRSYDEEIQIVAGDDITNEEIISNIDQAIDTLPIQEVYNETVMIVKDKIPESYGKVLNVIRVISKKSTMYTSIFITILLCFVIILVNRKQMRWLFPIGVGLLGSGLLLFVIGGIIPTIYQGLLARLGTVLASLSNIDFNIITYYGIGYTMFAMVCMVSHIIYQKVKKNRW